MISFLVQCSYYTGPFSPPMGSKPCHQSSCILLTVLVKKTLLLEGKGANNSGNSMIEAFVSHRQSIIPNFTLEVFIGFTQFKTVIWIEMAMIQMQKSMIGSRHVQCRYRSAVFLAMAGKNSPFRESGFNPKKGGNKSTFNEGQSKGRGGAEHKLGKPPELTISKPIQVTLMVSPFFCGSMPKDAFLFHLNI